MASSADDHSPALDSSALDSPGLDSPARLNRRSFGRTIWAAGAAATLLTLTGCPGGGGDDEDGDDDEGDDD